MAQTPCTSPGALVVHVGKFSKVMQQSLMTPWEKSCREGETLVLVQNLVHVQRTLILPHDYLELPSALSGPYSVVLPQSRSRTILEAYKSKSLNVHMFHCSHSTTLYSRVADAKPSLAERAPLEPKLVFFTQL